MRLGTLLALTTFAPDALAWGLQTHVFLAQWMLAALPLADPQFRAAALRLPRLVLAGACLPDLALAGRMLGLAAFRLAHRWSTVRRLATTCWDEERAIAVGYASHLLADVVAHNRFVPEHEKRIAHVPHVTHALCEWAMDEHVKPMLQAEPAALLGEDLCTLSEAATRVFSCSPSLARKGILFLARAERALRVSPLPRLCRVAAGIFDSRQYLDAFIGDAKLLVRQLDPVLSGAEPRWQPEPDHASAKEAPAMSAPSAPPAITSLG